MAAALKKKNGKDGNAQLPRYDQRPRYDAKREHVNPPGGGTKSPAVFGKEPLRHGYHAEGARAPHPPSDGGKPDPHQAATPPSRPAQLPRSAKKPAPTNHAGDPANKQLLPPTGGERPHRKDAVGIPTKQPPGSGKQPQFKGPGGDLPRAPKVPGLRKEHEAVRDVGVLAELPITSSGKRKRHHHHHHHHHQWCPGCADHRPGPEVLAVGRRQPQNRDGRPPGRLIMLDESSKRHRHHDRHHHHEDSSEMSTTELKTESSTDEMSRCYDPHIKTPFYKKLKLPSGRKVDVIHRNLYLRKWYKKRVRCEKGPFIIIFVTAIFMVTVLYLYLNRQEVLFEIVNYFRPTSDSPLVTVVPYTEADSVGDTSETSLITESTAASSIDNDTITVPSDLQWKVIR